MSKVAIIGLKVCNIHTDRQTDRQMTRQFYYLESVWTAWHGCKDVIGVHGSEDEVCPVPGLEAVPAEDTAARPALQTRHAHGSQVARLTLILHLKLKKKLVRL